MIYLILWLFSFLELLSLLFSFLFFSYLLSLLLILHICNVYGSAISFLFDFRRWRYSLGFVSPLVETECSRMFNVYFFPLCMVYYFGWFFSSLATCFSDAFAMHFNRRIHSCTLYSLLFTPYLELFTHIHSPHSTMV